VENIFHKIGQFVKMSDVIDDLPSKIVTNEYFELTKEQKKGIEDIIAIEPIVRFTAESQIVGGSLKGNEYTPPQYYKSEKLERAVEIAKENKKSIIVCHYNMELDLLAKLIPNSYVLNGDVSAIDKDRIIKEANNKDCCLLIQAQCSEGYSLSSFDLMVFYSLSWSVVDYLQMQARIIAAEKKRPVEYIHFVCKNSIDEKIYKNIIIEKKDFITKLYET
jgi:SNF2 family DNA or RNA helicase